MNIQKSLITITAIAFFLAICLPSFWALSHMLKASALGSFEQQPKTNSQSEVVGSIVVTDNTKQMVEHTRQQGLEPEAMAEETNQTPGLVRFDEKPDTDTMRQLDRQPGVKVVPDYSYKAAMAPNDPEFDVQWNLTKIDAPEAWEYNTGSGDVTVAVIDTGILFEQTVNGDTYTQPDFPTNRQWQNAGETGMTQDGDPCWTGASQDKQTNNCDDDDNGYIDDWRGWDFMGGFRGSSEACPNHLDPAAYQNPDEPSYIDQDNDVGPYSCDSALETSTLNKDHYNGDCEPHESACFVGHGTLVASVIAAQTNNNQLIAGIDHNVKIMNLRALDGYGVGSTSGVVAAIYYAVANGADVINLSLGSNCSNENFTDLTMEDALQAAKDNHVFVAAASGNDGFITVCYPASSSLAMAVGATNQSDLRQSYSNYSNKLDIVAPAGVPAANAPSAADNTNYLSSVHGTSLSTPHVAGLATLLKARNQAFTNDQIRQLIIKGADKVPGMSGSNFTSQYGYGRINVDRSLRAQLTTSSTKPKPVYRLYNSATNNHLYTTSASERDKAVSKANFRYETIAFRVCESGGQPLYRLYNPVTGRHFFTISAKERDRAASRTNFYKEGTAFRVCGSEKVYRLYSALAEKHFYTTSASERDKLVKQTSFLYEGVAFNVN